MNPETKSTPTPPPPYTACAPPQNGAMHPSPAAPRGGNHTTIHGHKNQTDQRGDNNHNCIDGNENRVKQALAPAPALLMKTLACAWARVTLALILIFAAWEAQNLMGTWMLGRGS